MRELRGAHPPRPVPEDPQRLSPDQPVWEVGGERSAAKEGHAASPGPGAGPGPRPGLEPGRGTGRRPGSRPGPGRLTAIVLALGLFAAGTAVGAALAGSSSEPARPATAAATHVAPTSTAAPTTAPAHPVSPPACLSAIDDADAVISYLVTNVRDQQLAATMERYRAASRACRRAR